MVWAKQQQWDIWTKPSHFAESPFQNFRFDRTDIPNQDASLFSQWVARAFDRLRELSHALATASDFKLKNEADPALTGYETLSDDDMLKLIDRLATVSSIHAGWAEDIRDTNEMLDRVKNNSPAVWNADAQRLADKLRTHLDTFEWVRDVTQRWSDEVGAYFDRMHPGLPPAPITPMDMGPTDSSRLPSVL